MHPQKDMKRIVDGKRYSVAASTLIASNEYWDGHNFERSGTNLFLYKTKNGAFFTVRLTQWQGERDRIEPVTWEEAIRLYEHELTEHLVNYENAFEVIVEDAGPGRPTLFDEKMRQTALYLTEDQITWLKSQPGTMSEIIRSLVDQARSV